MCKYRELTSMNCRQVVSVLRFGAGGIRRALRTRRMVEALARWPSLSTDCLDGRGDCGDMNVMGAGFDDEQAVQALQRQRAAGVEEVGGEHGRRLGVQELPPGRAGVPFRRGRNAQCLEIPEGRGRADPEAGLEQLALDPLVAPAVILAGE